MKRSVLIIGAIVLSSGLMGLNYLNNQKPNNTEQNIGSTPIQKMENNLASQLGIKKKPAYFFQLGPRFRPMKMQDSKSAKGVVDFLDSDALKQMEEVRSVRIRKFDENERYTVEANGNSEEFNTEQLEFLRNMNYSSNFVVEVVADFRVEGTEHLIRDMHTPHLTIVPEKQAEYVKGMGEFYQYLRKEAKAELEETDMDILGAAKLYFTISTEGIIKKIELRSSSNYEELDNKIIELIENLPGEWTAAENEAGDKVEQELVLSFGMIGC